MVHEIGHNLAMAHDFEGSPDNTRISESGEDCTAMLGYMNYVNNPNRWSPCSVDDFRNYYESFGSFCLELCKL